MPDEARIRRVAGDDTRWTVTEELLAQLIETVSITAAGMQLKEPRQITRPTDVSAATPIERKHGGLFMAAMERGMIGGSGDDAG